VLFRLYRSENRCEKEGRQYSKITDPARELVDLLAADGSTPRRACRLHKNVKARWGDREFGATIPPTSRA
jgi:hypothetical protein